MLGVGQKFPQFKLKATVSNDPKTGFTEISNSTYPGKWLVVFFYPKDFTFVCPTEIKAFGDLNGKFKERDTQVLAASVDNEFVHLAWRQAKDELRNLPFPMLADIKRELSSALGILDPNEGVSQRATFVVDPEGIIRHVSVYDLNVGRNPTEVLRTLDALQTDELCPCNWEKGKETLKVG
jgi:peroxiredoxin (alkyl hydroperoxide reductase subunit C)